jgi:hypothetical protein
MEELKQQLKALVVEDLPLLFARLKERLSSSCAQFNELLNLEAQYTSAQREWLGGRVAKEETDQKIARIRQALLNSIIDTLKTGDLKAETTAEGLTTLHDYHRFTCDRVEQSDRFQQLFAETRQQKIHFFYLYGMDLQSHRGIFRRIAYDLEGRLQDYLNPDLKATCTALQIELTFDVSHDPEIYKQNILKSLLAALSVRVNEHEPLLDKHIVWLQQHSPVLQGLDKDDYLCIFVGISEWDWNKDITPLVTRWFIKNYCGVTLPDDFPSILFFFAIMYEEDGSPVEKEVEEVVAQSDLVTALPELGMVNMRDIGAWFNKYNFLAPSSRELKDLRNHHFSGTAEFYMDDVELKLKRLIDEYNKKFF